MVECYVRPFEGFLPEPFLYWMMPGGKLQGGDELQWFVSTRFCRFEERCSVFVQVKGLQYLSNFPSTRIAQLRLQYITSEVLFEASEI